MVYLVVLDFDRDIVKVLVLLFEAQRELIEPKVEEFPALLDQRQTKVVDVQQEDRFLVYEFIFFVRFVSLISRTMLLSLTNFLMWT